jgi:predicted glycosyltransferase
MSPVSPMSATRMRVAIYAPGGGRGHLARAAAIARRFANARIDGDGELPGDADVLIVDTFPRGRRGELTDGVLARFARRVLVRRYVRDLAIGDDASAYHRVWLPYARDACEWDGAMAGTHVGPLVRALRIAPDERCGARASLVVLGDLDRLPWPVRVAGARFVRAWTDAIPAADAYFVVGAGHNTVYELRRLGVRFAAYPLDRRYDDQHRRVARLGIGVWSPADLDAFVLRARSSA